MSESILVINAGSSSLKFAIHAGPALQCVARGEVDDLGAAAKLTTTIGAAARVVRRVDAGDASAALRIVADWIMQEFPAADFAAIGHRIVHGGTRYHEPVVLDDAILHDLEALDPLAPQHQPYNLAAVGELRMRFPDALPVACFDTAFHAGWDDCARRLAVPRRFHDAGVQRYGFHGLSCEYLCGRMRDLAPQAQRVVIAHLGGGSSISAVRDGRSVESTMGFSVLDGLPMATRSGAIDPGAIFHLHRQHGMDFDQIEHMLYYDSGMRGVSGISCDMRTLLASDRVEAREAIALYAHRCTGAIGAMAAMLGGIDALVFSGGIGAHASTLRASICAPLAFLGLAIDNSANELESAERISAPTSKVDVFAQQTDEELIIARHCHSLLAARSAGLDQQQVQALRNRRS